MNSASDIALVAYVASPHDGYLQLFRHYAGSTLWVLGEDFIAQFPSLVRHLPGNRPADAKRMIAALDIFSSVDILTRESIEQVRQYSMLVMPEEEVSRAIAEKHFGGMSVTFDGRWRLRWYKAATVYGWHPDGVEQISTDELDVRLLQSAQACAEHSPDWWRQVGALLVCEGKVLLAACNQHVPAEQGAYLFGDPRSNFEPGEHIELSLAEHAEAIVIAEAARRGIRTEGCDLYVTTFPCPPCAYACARAGIRRLYYATGYSLVAGAEVLRARDVEIIRVQLPDDPRP